MPSSSRMHCQCLLGERSQYLPDINLFLSVMHCAFYSGYIGERMPLRYFLGFGMILCGLCTTLFGMGYFWDIHNLGFFIVAQVCCPYFVILFATTSWSSQLMNKYVTQCWQSHLSALHNSIQLYTVLQKKKRAVDSIWTLIASLLSCHLHIYTNSAICIN